MRKPASERVKQYEICKRFEVLTAMRMLMLVFWVVTLCGLVGRYHTNISQEHTASIFSPHRKWHKEYFWNICVLYRIHFSIPVGYFVGNSVIPYAVNIVFPSLM
jgi:uncharacterized membrane protein